MPINQLGTMGVPEPSLILISPWDPAAVALIDKAIRTSDLGLNPASDGKVVRVPIPPLTEERRKDMVKHLHKVLENHRTAVRNIRRDIKEAIEKLEKDKMCIRDRQEGVRRAESFSAAPSNIQSIKEERWQSKSP